LIVRGVNLFPTQVEEIVLKTPELAAQYQLVLTRSGNMDELEILTEVRPEFDHLSVADRDVVAGKLKHAIKTYIGVSARVTVQSAGLVARTLTGKARRVVDKRQRSYGRPGASVANKVSFNVRSGLRTDEWVRGKV